jgi:hypothetical protein
MLTSRVAARALVVGTIGLFVTMGLHPTGAEALANAERGGLNLLARGVHALAIAMMPLLLVGFLGVTRRLQARPGLSACAFASWGLALVSVMLAAIMSGLVAPALADRIAESAASQRDDLLRLLRYTGTLNQAFAAVYVALGGAAMVAWSLALRAERGAPRLLPWLGVVAGAVAAVGTLGGWLALDVRGFGAVVLGQGVWMLGVAWWLGREGPDVATGERAEGALGNPLASAPIVP